MQSETRNSYEPEPTRPSPAMADERRSSNRVQTVFRVARVVTNTDQGLARVQNISDEGVRLRVHLPVLLGDTLALELAEGISINGDVVWSDGLDCGLRLQKEVDSAALLTRLAAQAREAASRPLRLPIITPALTRSAAGTRVVEIADISQRGMKLKHDGSFSEGLGVKITLPSGKERRGIVRWSHEMIAGVMLLEPFSVEDLGSASSL
ncbi:PilZ domain-containing protein [Sphingomonas sp. M1-B02]|uniref:PilZ domain-containing protein n=1 Tax=Sphingomonas sp. M1-B02 TaxID=3114300 RepID=UPI0022408A66|nr:PilZ domain-containing protein [Sphingomonas sp. S6-11]UZK67064.1 PilZ domain-containing protein [Sphingomonas sp. S6-11]